MTDTEITDEMVEEHVAAAMKSTLSAPSGTWVNAYARHVAPLLAKYEALRDENEKLRRVAEAAQGVYPHCPSSGKQVIDGVNRCELCDALAALMTIDGRQVTLGSPIWKHEGTSGLENGVWTAEAADTWERRSPRREQ